MFDKSGLRVSTLEHFVIIYGVILIVLNSRFPFFRLHHRDSR